MIQTGRWMKVRRVGVQWMAAVLLLSVLPLLCQTAPLSQPDTEARVESLLKQLSLEEKVDLIGGVDGFYIREIPHIHFPRLKMSDGPIGVRNYGPSTAFGGVGMAAAWDPELAQKMGTIVGQDARARGVHFMLGPGVNIYRSPLNGRNFEYFGEDPSGGSHRGRLHRRNAEPGRQLDGQAFHGKQFRV